MLSRSSQTTETRPARPAERADRKPTLTSGQRIDIIKECATLLGKSDFSEIDLVLYQYGLSTAHEWSGDARSYVMAMLGEESDDALTALNSYLTRESDRSSPGESPFRANRLRLFMSHLATQREFVGHVGAALQLFGVESFVAHDAIEPSLEWQAVIEAALTDCDAMVLFLHPGIITSPWCDQEVGWAFGRRRPILPLKFESDPYGFMGKLQAQHCAGKSAVQVSNAIAQWLVKTSTLHTAMATSLSWDFAILPSWDFTRRLAPLLRAIPNFAEDQLGLLEEAARINIDVRDCFIDGMPGPAWVDSFAKERRDR